MIALLTRSRLLRPRRALGTSLRRSTARQITKRFRPLALIYRRGSRRTTGIPIFQSQSTKNLLQLQLRWCISFFSTHIARFFGAGQAAEHHRVPAGSVMAQFANVDGPLAPHDRARIGRFLIFAQPARAAERYRIQPRHSTGGSLRSPSDRSGHTVELRNAVDIRSLNRSSPITALYSMLRRVRAYAARDPGPGGRLPHRPGADLRYKAGFDGELGRHADSSIAQRTRLDVTRMASKRSHFVIERVHRILHTRSRRESERRGFRGDGREMPTPQAWPIPASAARHRFLPALYRPNADPPGQSAGRHLGAGDARQSVRRFPWPCPSQRSDIRNADATRTPTAFRRSLATSPPPRRTIRVPGSSRQSPVPHAGGIARTRFIGAGGRSADRRSIARRRMSAGHLSREPVPLTIPIHQAQVAGLRAASTYRRQRDLRSSDSDVRASKTGLPVPRESQSARYRRGASSIAPAVIHYRSGDDVVDQQPDSVQQPQTAPPPEPPKLEIDVEHLSREVLGRIEDTLRVERERSGRM